MDTVELTSGQNKAVIQRDGAWLVSLADNKGDILFPRQMLTAHDGNPRARGGSHVCLPNFGPGGDTNLSQHGFGRTSSWKVTEQGKTSVTLELEGGAPGYDSLLSKLTYTLGEHSLTMSLSVTNRNDSVMRIAPGFHPYFALSATDTEVTIDDTTYDPATLSTAVFVEGTHKTLTTKGRHIWLSSDNLSTWAIWSDKLGNYICVEPTFGGFTFIDSQPEEEELVRRGIRKTYKMTISW